MVQHCHFVHLFWKYNSIHVLSKNIVLWQLTFSRLRKTVLLMSFVIFRATVRLKFLIATNLATKKINLS